MRQAYCRLCLHIAREALQANEPLPFSDVPVPWPDMLLQLALQPSTPHAAGKRGSFVTSHVGGAEMGASAASGSVMANSAVMTHQEQYIRWVGRQLVVGCWRQPQSALGPVREWFCVG